MEYRMCYEGTLPNGSIYTRSFVVADPKLDHAALAAISTRMVDLFLKAGCTPEQARLAAEHPVRIEFVEAESIQRGDSNE